MIDPKTVKVGDVLWDLVKKERVKVCGCLLMVRSRIGYVRKNPHEFAYEKPTESDK